MPSPLQTEEISKFRDACRRTAIIVGLLANTMFVAPVSLDQHGFSFVLNLASQCGLVLFTAAAVFEFFVKNKTVATWTLFPGAIAATTPYLMAIGIGTAETAWLPFMALVGCLIGGTRHGVIWMLGAIATAIVSGVWGTEPHLGAVFEIYGPGDPRLYYTAIAILITVLTTASYAALEHFYLQSTNRLIEANASLEETLRERDQLRERLLEGQKLESLGLMAGGLAHDFNNLLTGIIGELDIAALDAADDPRVLESVEYAKESALAASEMTEALLSYAGRKPVRRTAIDPLAVADFVRSIAATATGRSVPIVVDAAESSRTFVGDRAQIEQVLLNLTMNAVQAMEGQRGEVVVSVNERFLADEKLQGNRALTELEPGPYVVIEVSDPGTGISDDELQRIFEPFFTSKATGRGLGLAATLGIVRSHKGGLFVETTVGEGTTFKVAFPAVEREEHSSQFGDAAAITGARNVLVVDDRPEVSTALGRLIESFGLNAIVRSSAAEGLALFEQAPGSYDVALLDIMMPDMRGDELARRLRDVRDDLPIVFMSGYVDESAVLDDLENTQFLSKPIRRQELHAVLVSTVPVGHPTTYSSSEQARPSASLD